MTPSIEEWGVIHREPGGDGYLRGWQDLDVVTGRELEFWEGRAGPEERAVGVDPAAHLRVQSARERLHVVVVGDVRSME